MVRFARSLADTRWSWTSRRRTIGLVADALKILPATYFDDERDIHKEKGRRSGPDQTGSTADGAPDVFEMTGSSTLTEMVEAARGGDRDSWNQLVERYMPLVMSVAGRYRLGASDVADVSQAVWLRLVEHLDDLREPRALPGWIVTTTKNEALHLLKTRQRAFSVDPQASLLDGATNGAEPEDDLLRLERHQALRDGLLELRPQQRELLLLLLADPPVPYDEISRRLGIARGSIGPTRARCLDALRNTNALSQFRTTGESVF